MIFHCEPGFHSIPQYVYIVWVSDAICNSSKRTSSSWDLPYRFPVSSFKFKYLVKERIPSKKINIKPAVLAMLNWEKTALKSIDFYQHSSCVRWLSKEEKHVIKDIFVYFGRLAPLTMRRVHDLLSQISSNISLSKQQKSWIIMEKSVKATKINHPDLWKKSTV